MKASARSIQKVFLSLTLFNTLATSFIWGINTLFLLDAGLTNTQAFAANAFFTAGQVIFEVPTGVVADSWGRRTSYLLGALTLAISTFAYFLAWQMHAPFWAWAATSALLGLGYTFFSGATEAWLVDALNFTNFKGSLDSVFAKGQIVSGAAMLAGSVAGGYIAQVTNLGVPYLARCAVLALTFVLAFIFMKDLGFTADKEGKVFSRMRRIFSTSVNAGLKNPPVRWMMIASIFTTGVSFYAFYAMQPYLLKLWGDQSAYLVAGLAASLLALSQIIGGIAVPYVRKIFARRTSAMLACTFISVLGMVVISLTSNFWIAILLLAIWGLCFSAIMPIRQTFLNGLIPSKQRATVLSFDALMGSSGGVFIQPVLGRVADASGYAASYMVGSVFQALALPFIYLSRRDKAESDVIGA